MAYHLVWDDKEVGILDRQGGRFTCDWCKRISTLIIDIDGLFLCPNCWGELQAKVAASLTEIIVRRSHGSEPQLSEENLKAQWAGSWSQQPD